MSIGRLSNRLRFLILNTKNPFYSGGSMSYPPDIKPGYLLACNVLIENSLNLLIEYGYPVVFLPVNEILPWQKVIFSRCKSTFINIISLQCLLFRMMKKRDLIISSVKTSNLLLPKYSKRWS